MFEGIENKILVRIFTMMENDCRGNPGLESQEGVADTMC